MMAEAGRAAPESGAPMLHLACRPGRTGNILVFPYTLQNRGPVDVYAMHALPRLDPVDHTASADQQAAVVMLGADGDAIVGKFAAPLPTDRRVAFPILPLARRLAPQEGLEGRLEIPLPLAETSPYFPDLTLRQYEIVDVTGVVFTIGFWLAGTDGLTALPASYAADLFNIVTRDTLRSARRVSQRFPTSGLQLFKRRDEFPRALD
jgi:hypothetical protein